MKGAGIILLIAAALIAGCENHIPGVSAPNPPVPDPLSNTSPLTAEMQRRTEGVFIVEQGREDFGDSVVLKWNAGYCSLFAGKNSAYCVMQCGHNDSAVVFSGFWRFAQSEYTGTMTFSAEAAAADCILHGEGTAESVTLRGLFGDGNKPPWKPVTLRFKRALTRRPEGFYIIGHRGGGRNIDRLPVSENTCEMIRYSERLGANAVEIDVQCTKDGVPVLFHDQYLTTRLVNEDYMTGKVSDYTLAQLKTLCTLKNGERIPTLREALQTAIEQTHHRLVWLDIKAYGIVATVAAVQREYIELARQQRRDIEIVMGLAEDAPYNEYMRLAPTERPPALCEFDEPRVIESGAVIWAPRWSRGLLNDRIAAMKARGVRVFTWTVDLEDLIHTFFTESDPDGMLSNYPAMVAYEYYTH